MTDAERDIMLAEIAQDVKHLKDAWETWKGVMCSEHHNRIGRAEKDIRRLDNQSGAQAAKIAGGVAVLVGLINIGLLVSAFLK